MAAAGVLVFIESDSIVRLLFKCIEDDFVLTHVVNQMFTSLADKRAAELAQAKEDADALAEESVESKESDKEKKKKKKKDKKDKKEKEEVGFLQGDCLMPKNLLAKTILFGK